MDLFIADRQENGADNIRAASVVLASHIGHADFVSISCGLRFQ
jgi:hypothetical protein